MASDSSVPEPGVTNSINGHAAPTAYKIPTTMKAIRYNKIKDFSLVTMPVPQPKAHEILVKGESLSIMPRKTKVDTLHSEILRCVRY
jgi:hypothetical protein